MNLKLSKLSKLKLNFGKKSKKAKPKQHEPKPKKIRIAIMPLFGFEVIVATFLDKDKYEIIPLDMSEKGLTDKFGQELFGEWCYPLKLAAAMIEKAVVEKKVSKVIGYNINICRYPLVLGDMTKWIKKDFEYHPIMVEELCLSPQSCVDMFKQMKKAIPGFSAIATAKKGHIAIKRSLMAGEMSNAYLRYLPLVKNPKTLKNDFKKARYDLIRADSLRDSDKVVKEFESKAEKQTVRKEPKHRILISGDASVISVEFALLEIDIFLAKQGIEIVNPGFPATTYHRRFSKNGKKATELISKVLSHKDNKREPSSHYIIEHGTLFQILEGIDRGVDGIIYIKPNMCSPCENVSYILKEVKSFGLPIVEISYDEHQGVNAVLTRLEAFISIVEEKKSNEKN